MNKKMTFALLADTHINLPFPYAKRMRQLQQALQYIETREDIQGLFVCGDVSDHGVSMQMESFAYAISKFKQSSKKDVYCVLGNHDFNHYLPIRMSNLETWNEMQASLGEAKTSTLYQEVQIDDTVILMLQSERRIQTASYLSQQQVTWLASKLEFHKEAARVFILHHQPLTYTHMGSEYYGLGEQDEQVKAILKKHGRAVWISGHIHNDPSTIRPLCNAFGIQIDVPSFQLTRWHGGHTGCGLLLEVDGHMLSIQVFDFLHQIGYQRYQIDGYKKCICEVTRGMPMDGKHVII